MRRSEIEMQIDVLNVLVQKGPSKVTHIQRKGNFNYTSLKRLLEILLVQGLVEEREIRKQIHVYAITQKGTITQKGFTELK